MKKLGLLLFFFMCSSLNAKVVCQAPDTVGDSGTEASNIQQECNAASQDSAVVVNDREVNVQQIANVLTSDTVSSDPDKSSSENPDASGATK